MTYLTDKSAYRGTLVRPYVAPGLSLNGISLFFGCKNFWNCNFFEENQLPIGMVRGIRMARIIRIWRGASTLLDCAKKQGYRINCNLKWNGWVHTESKVSEKNILFKEKSARCQPNCLFHPVYIFLFYWFSSQHISKVSPTKNSILCSEVTSLEIPVTQRSVT